MAGQIPKEFITRLLQSADITEVIGSRIQLKPAGSSHKGLCPFHKEKTPSFNVNRGRQLYYCFGCGAGGNTLHFLMEYEKLDFVAAVETLAESIGLKVPREGGNRPEDSDMPKIRKMLEDAADFYYGQLGSSAFGKKAIAYLKDRGLDGKTAKKFKIGCVPNDWDTLLKALGRGEAERIRLLEKAGLITRKEGDKIYDRLRGRIVFPIRDARGQVTGFGGRVLPDSEEGQPKYINSPETPVFQKRRILYGLYEMQQALRAKRLPKPDSVILVEGYMDVAMLSQHGIDNTVAALGTALGVEHMALAFRYAPTVILCLDGDTAGYRAAERALEPVLSAMRDGFEVRFLFLPEGEDPDSLVRAKGREYFQEMLKQQSRPLYAFLFEQLEKNAYPENLEGRARMCRDAEPLLSLLPPEADIYRQLLIGELAKRTELETEKVEKALAVMGQRRQPAPSADALPPASTAALEQIPPPDAVPPEYAAPPPDMGLQNKTGKEVRNLAKQIIPLLLCHSAPGRLELDGLYCPPGMPSGGILQKLLHYLREHPKASPGDIFAYYEELAQPRDQEPSNLLALVHGDDLDDPIEKELRGIREKLEQQAKAMEARKKLRQKLGLPAEEATAS